jgi:sugar phosphate isomerase/epimerase
MLKRLKDLLMCDDRPRPTGGMARRDCLKAGAATAILAATASLAAIAGRADGNSPGRRRTGLGLVIYALNLRRKAMKLRDAQSELFEPLALLEFCHGLGAGGVQLPLGRRDAEYARKLCRQAEQWGMFLEGIVSLPQREADVERFEAEIRTAAQAGARVVRTTMIAGRRYEQYRSQADFRDAIEQGRKSLTRAVPLVERHQVRLAVENHKDERVEERLALFRKIHSQWVGACVDLGNSLSLLEEPLAVVEAYAPWAFTVHLKDQAVREYPEGFLLADVPLGEGFLDLKAMVAVLRRARPEIHFGLETIIRDPLQVPCLTEKYWATMADVPGCDLARTLRTVRARQASALPQVDRLSLEEQVACESAGIEKSLGYAGEVLGI